MNPEEPYVSGVRIAPAPAGDVVASLRELTKLYPLNRDWSESILHPLQEEQVAVVQKVTVDVRAGEVFGVLGMDGAGKTTLLRMLAAELPPDGGSATVGGWDIARHADEVRRVVQLAPAHEEVLDAGLTARENLERVLNARPGWSEEKEGRTGRIEEVLRIVQLHDAAERRAGVCTPSMKRRLLIARALLFRPSVLLLDEPARGLATAAAREVRGIFKGEALAKEKCTVILATQEPQEAFEACHRVGILDRGKLLAVRTPEAFLETLGTEWYRLWMRQVGLDALMTLTGHRDIRGFRSHASAGRGGWTQVEVEIPEGLEAASRVLASLTKAGIKIARFERVGLSLPRLIDRLDVSPESNPGAGGNLKKTEAAAGGLPENPPLIF